MSHVEVFCFCYYLIFNNSVPFFYLDYLHYTRSWKGREVWI